ncbi:MAG: cytidylate kinase-like family protein [Nitrospinae bacterium]|nr:cytidylate kinase-like family protein [Nitrospinota bacterium]MBL7019315.1 cytidylate kinase-like family protein [Nitrospinaceae bacterium]
MSNAIPESIAEQIIAEKIREWNDNRKRAKKSQTEVHHFLAIARDFGCREEAIIPQLEGALGWRVYGKDLINHIAEREELNRNFLETLDEKKQTQMENWVNYLITSGAILQKDYVLRITRLMEAIVINENAILLGRGANFILNERKEGLRIKLTAPLDDRIKNIMEVRSLPLKEAEQIVKEKDKEREAFISAYFKAATAPEFDLAFNTSVIDADMICEMIKFALKKKGLTS